MNSKIAIRVDASALIGTGHFIRCLTLADVLKKRGMAVWFISRHLPDHLAMMLILHGHHLKKLDAITETILPQETVYSDWLGTRQSTDADHTLAALADEEWQWLIVDHYALDARWETAIRPAVNKILVIDDIADRTHDCDLLLDQNFHLDMESRYTHKTPDTCKFLLGPRYALLRETFKKLRLKIHPRTGAIHRILVFFGGVDMDNCTQRTINALAGMELAGVSIDIVIGAQHPNRVSITEACHQLGFSCHVQTEQMAELMAAADLAIGAGGSASWERCCLGLPSLIVVLADNQREIARGLDHLGAAVLIGDSTITEAIISETIQTIMSNINLLQSLSKKAYSMVDGEGTHRVCQEMELLA